MANEKIVNSYETMYIVDVSVTEEETKAVVEKFKALIEANGTVESFEEMGRRRLAYPIQDKNEGYYVLVKYTAQPDFIAELDRVFNINDKILRSMTTRV